MPAFLDAIGPLPLAGIGAALILLLLLLRSRTGGPRKLQRRNIPGIDRLLSEGRYHDAAELAVKHERLEEALDYFLRAQNPGRAAQLAARLGNARRAAELYERAGNAAMAAKYYEQAGMTQKARELQAGTRAKNTPEPAAPIAAVPGDARQKADALLAAGDLRAAADAYRDGGLHDEAIHLYVNVLALPGEAAPLVARRGHHERAAELYELAGLKERAAAQWADIARGAKQPEIYVERISQLHEGTALKLLEDVTASRPLSRATAELYYLLAGTLARTGDSERAVRVYVSIESEVGTYKDVPAQLRGLQSGAPRTATQRAPSHARDASSPILADDLLMEEISSLAKQAAQAAVEEVRRAAVAGLEDTIVKTGKGERTTFPLAGAPQPPERYQLLGELGRGGMAVVYRALDQVLGREVALKFLADEHTHNREVTDLFLREARAVAQLNHPNIITIYDFGTLDGRIYIAMELVEGQTVRELLQARPRMPVVEALRLILQLLTALDYAHKRKIIHRDIKPSNVMRLTSGVVKLMDFGLAKSLQGGGQSSIVAGTPAYMPPEQMLGLEVDPRTDVFAVGVTLYEMLSGKLPYQGLDRTQPPKPLAEHVPSIPGAIDRMVLKAVAAEPTDRYLTAAGFAGPIRRVLDAFEQFTTGDLRPMDLPAAHASADYRVSRTDKV